jgi:hypothetical protein
MKRKNAEVPEKMAILKHTFTDAERLHHRGFKGAKLTKFRAIDPRMHAIFFFRDAKKRDEFISKHEGYEKY